MRLGVFIPAATVCSAAMAAYQSASAEVFARFDIWVEAPEVVQAGEVVDVQVWAELSGPVLDIGLNAMAGFRMNLPVNTSGNLVSEVEQPRFGHPFFSSWVGEVNANGVFDVGAHQLDIWDTPIWLNNPIFLYSTRLHTVEGATGEIELVPERHDPTPSMIAWWIDIDDPHRPIVSDTDSNTELHIVGRTIRIVPGPASLGLLAFAGLGAARRGR